MNTLITVKGYDAKQDLFENLDFSLNRIEGSKTFAGLVDKVVADFNPMQPEKSVLGLIKAYQKLGELKDEQWREFKRQQLEELIVACSGLWMEALSKEHYVIPGGRPQFTGEIIVQSPLEIKLNKIVYPALEADTIIAQTLTPNQLYSYEKAPIISSNLDYSNPYWLSKPSNGNLFTVENQQLIGKGENDAALHMQFHITIDGVDFIFHRPVVYKWRDPVD